MISYPLLERNATIGVTAPSSGVSEEHHSLLESALKRMEEKSFQVVTERRFGRKIRKNQVQQENEQMNSIK